MNQSISFLIFSINLISPYLTSADLQGPLAGKQISDSVNLLKTGGAYINVHTSKNQDGEIRGQVS